MGLSFGYAWTDIDWQFEGDPAPSVEEVSPLSKYASTIIIERRLGERSSLQIGVGAVLGGTLEVRETKHDIGPGWVYSAAFAHQLLRKNAPLFLIGSASLGASLSLTEERDVESAPVERLFALDARLGLTLGKTLNGWLSPYGSLRFFGLPIFWRFEEKSIVGSDANNYAIAAGVMARPAEWIDLFFDAATVGETGITIGAATSF